MAVNLLYATLMLEQMPSARHPIKLYLSELPVSLKEAPDYLNIMKVTQLTESLAAVSRRCDVVIKESPEALMSYATKLNETLGPLACRLNSE